MNLERMKLWTKALRSGKYKQTRGTLAKVNKRGIPQSFCCLGVACEVYAKATGKEFNWYFNAEGSVLPNTVKKWFGMKTWGGTYTPSKSYWDGTRDLIGDNDTAKRNFNKIADIIEKHAKEL